MTLAAAIFVLLQPELAPKQVCGLSRITVSAQYCEICLGRGWTGSPMGGLFARVGLFATRAGLAKVGQQACGQCWPAMVDGGCWWTSLQWPKLAGQGWREASVCWPRLVCGHCRKGAVHCRSRAGGGTTSGRASFLNLRGSKKRKCERLPLLPPLPSPLILLLLLLRLFDLALL